jgi:hypothetical protein
MQEDHSKTGDPVVGSSRLVMPPCYHCGEPSEWTITRAGKRNAVLRACNKCFKEFGGILMLTAFPHKLKFRRQNDPA